MRIFGARYDAPAFEDAIRLETPVGKRCVMCNETVEIGDSGVFMPTMLADGRTGIEPEHLECHLRSVLGSVEHLEGRCHCYHGPLHHDGEMSYRDSARAVMAWADAHTSGSGRGPMPEGLTQAL